MPVNVEVSIRLIPHGRWLRDFTIPVVDQASFLILHGHLSLANALLSTCFDIIPPGVAYSTIFH